MFICDKCGLCCMKIGESPIYSFLDRGDGICKYFDYDTKLCSIYDERPVMCNYMSFILKKKFHWKNIIG